MAAMLPRFVPAAVLCVAADNRGRIAHNCTCTEYVHRNYGCVRAPNRGILPNWVQWGRHTHSGRGLTGLLQHNRHSHAVSKYFVELYVGNRRRCWDRTRVGARARISFQMGPEKRGVCAVRVAGWPHVTHCRRSSEVSQCSIVNHRRHAGWARPGRGTGRDCKRGTLRWRRRP